MNESLSKAFAVLGYDRNLRDLELVADALHRSGDEEAMGLLDAAATYDRGALDRLDAIAEANRSNGLVALDLLVVFHSGIDALIRKSPAE